MKLTSEQKKTLAQIEVLQDLNFPREQLEASIVSLLQWVYKDNEKDILNHFEHMDEMRNRLIRH